MARTTIAEQLEIAIRSAAREAEPSASSREVAATFYADNRDLLQPFIQDWVIEKLGILISKHRAKTRREDNPQLVFEIALGIEHRPRSITVKSGAKVLRYEATITDWREHRACLWKENHPELEDADKIISIMEPVTKDHANRGITWGEVIEREANKKAQAAV